jgi:hypothetical protein
MEVESWLGTSRKMARKPRDLSARGKVETMAGYRYSMMRYAVKPSGHRSLSNI